MAMKVFSCPACISCEHNDVIPGSYATTSADALVADWQPVEIAVNNINRAMGQPDLYPFVISPPVIQKLNYIMGLIHNR
jgi:hypothetical protein